MKKIETVVSQEGRMELHLINNRKYHLINRTIEEMLPRIHNLFGIRLKSTEIQGNSTIHQVPLVKLPIFKIIILNFYHRLKTTVKL